MGYKCLPYQLMTFQFHEQEACREGQFVFIQNPPGYVRRRMGDLKFQGNHYGNPISCWNPLPEVTQLDP